MITTKNNNIMNPILGFLGFCLWLISTLILALSVVGIVILMGFDDDWLGIGKNLVRSFIPKEI